ncbi:MAG: SH3 domain-containing protein [Patescibacteria group bacterium]
MPLRSRRFPYLMTRARILLAHLIPLLSLLMGGCGSSSNGYESVTFTEQDAAQISALLDQLESGQTTGAGAASSTSSQASLPGATAAVDVTQPAMVPVVDVAIDTSQEHRFDALRAGIQGPAGTNALRVTNTFLNVRAEPRVQSAKVEELTKGDRLKLLSFPNAAWVEVELPDGRKGFVNASYVAQLATESMLPKLKEQYAGLYYVDFTFLNVRASPASSGQKIGELAAQQIIKPVSISDAWARIVHEGKEGYVSTEYLRPFQPSFLVRQESFALPILRYQGDETDIGATLVKHLALLKSWGKKVMTLREYYDLLLAQEEKDVRQPPGAVVLTITDLTAASLKEVADALRATGVRATIFLTTGLIAPDGIAPQQVTTLSANGHNIASAGHSGDDLRALTNAQVALDLTQSAGVLKELTGKDIFAVAYPSGGVNDRVAEQALKTGYLFGLTLNPGSTFDRREFLRLPANLISPGTPEGTLRALVGG